MEKNNKSHDFYERLKGVEVGLENLKEDFKMFSTNHFEGFKKEVKSEISKFRTDVQGIKDKLNSRPSWLIAGLFGLLSSLITYLITRG